MKTSRNISSLYEEEAREKGYISVREYAESLGINRDVIISRMERRKYFEKFRDNLIYVKVKSRRGKSVKIYILPTEEIEKDIVYVKYVKKPGENRPYKQQSKEKAKAIIERRTSMKPMWDENTGQMIYVEAEI